MTDAELIAMARLAQRDERMSTGALYGDLADRIEELTAKLAKAVEALEDTSGNGNAAGRNPQLMSAKARATIAEIKGESHE